MSHYREAADCLQRGRILRLSGNIASAVKMEKRAENILYATCCNTGHADLLLTVWECSMADSPIEIEEWRETKAYALVEQLEAGYIQRLPHVTGGGL